MGRTGLKGVQERIDSAAHAAGRLDPITLVVVAKNASDEELSAAIAEGARHIGESRSDSLVSRVERFDDVLWHFVGRLQGNKARKTRSVTDLLHSMDRHALADYWADGVTAPPPALIQVNLAGEDQKAGVTSSDALPLIEKCVELSIEVQGLMTVPPRPDKPGDSARWFTELRELRDRIARDHPQVKELSMGMSEDFPIAVAEGATILRVGRAIFDPFRNEG